MRKLIKALYEWKIRFVFYFNLGYGEFGTPIAVIRDIGIVLAVLKILFKVSFSWLADVIICIISFLVFYFIGRVLTYTKMTQFANTLSNKYNPELAAIRKIADFLGINVDV